MKKLRVLSLMLALIILSSVFAVTGNAAYQGYNSIKDIATVTVLDEGVYTAGLDELRQMDISLNTFDKVVYHGNYTGDAFKTTAGEGTTAAPADRRTYYYNSVPTTVNDTNIATFKFRNCGTVNG